MGRKRKLVGVRNAGARYSTPGPYRLLPSGTFGRPAREDDELQHGVYTYHLLESLTWSLGEADSNGDGAVSMDDFYNIMTKKTFT